MPRAAQTMARAMPVLPLVGSTTMVSGPMSPASWAASIIATPMRSLTEFAGLKNSSLADDLGPRAVGDPADPHEGGVADQFGDVVGDAHVVDPSITGPPGPDRVAPRCGTLGR